MSQPPRLSTAFEDKADPRPQSPHNVSTPVTVRAEGAFLSVPTNTHRSRQNSIDTNDDGATTRTAVPSVAEPAASPTTSSSPTAVAGEETGPAGAPISEKGGEEGGGHGGGNGGGGGDRPSGGAAPGAAPNNDRIMTDPDALKPDKEDDAPLFRVDDNPFAFTPGQLSKMFEPKNLAAFFALGGLAGLEKGLRSDRKAGLSVDESRLDGAVSFEDATARQHGRKEEADKPGSESSAAPITRSESKRTTTTALADGSKSAVAASAAFADRKRVYLDNRLPEKKGKTLLQLMWITYNDKILILLSIAAVISLAVGIYQTVGIRHKEGEAKLEWVEGVAIVVAIVIVVLVGSLNDYQKERQFAKLNRKKQDRVVRVTRSGRLVELSVHDVLVGDVINLEPGDLVPVDGVLVRGFNVKCDESQATGESDIIRKRPADEVYAAIEAHRDLRKMDPFIQSGARVMEGVGAYMATATGVNSTYGRTMLALQEDPDMTPLQSKLNVIAEMIAKLGGVAALLLFLVLFIQFLAGLRNLPESTTPAEKGQQFLNIFIVVVTIIVVAVPEGLPLAVTLALAFATTRMLRDNNLVRVLKACEVMGNATTICSDKTGTLTQNRMTVVAGTVGIANRFGSESPASDKKDPADDGNAIADADAYDTAEADNAATAIAPAQFAAALGPDVRTLLRNSISLNSTAFEGDAGDGHRGFIGSKTETALLEFARSHLGMGPVAEERENAQVLQMIPFDSSRKCMGIVVRLPGGGAGDTGPFARLYIKGASEIVLDRCVTVLADPSDGSGLETAAVTAESRTAVTDLITAYASNSLRTIGLAYRDLLQWPPRGARRADGSGDSSSSSGSSVEVELVDLFRNMTLIGIVGIRDPLRDGVRDAVGLCQRAGVVVRMVTGDNRLTAESIARECGILQPDSIVLEGPEFRRMTRDAQRQIAPKLHVLARSSPDDKRTLVDQLRSLGETVAVTGDGTNDAPALKNADIGFSMGIAGTEVAKEASDIVLMDDNFRSIVSALMWGRAVNDAVKRFLQFQLTVNVTAVVLTFVTAVSNDSETSVLTAVQLLWVNLIMDTLAALALATDPPAESVLDRPPERRNAGIISITMWKMIMGQSVYQLAVTMMLYWGSLARPDVLPTDQVPTAAQVNVLVFNTFVWMQIFNQWNNRRLDNKFNIFEGITHNWIFIAISLLMMAAQVIIIRFGGPVFNIPPEGQTGLHWAIALVLGFISIPVGVLIRLIPDRFIQALVPSWRVPAWLVPSWLRHRPYRRHPDGGDDNRGLPGLTISDEERADYYHYYASPLTEVRDQLAFLKRVKGGRLNNLKFAMRHPRETFIQRTSRSLSRSRSGSVRTSAAGAPGSSSLEREDSFGSGMGGGTGGGGIGGGATQVGGVPDSAATATRARSRSMRSRSNSALGAPTVMAGLVAAGVAAGWQPSIRTPSRDETTTSSQTPMQTPQAQTQTPQTQTPRIQTPQTQSQSEPISSQAQSQQSQADHIQPQSAV